MKWTEEDIAKLRSMYDTHYTNVEIAAEFGCSVMRVKDGLRNHGISHKDNAAARRALSTVKNRVPSKYREPSPIPEVVTTTPEPRNRELHFLDAIEHNLCCWLDGKLKACGQDRFHGNRYCKHHWEKSLKRNEVK